MTSLKIISKFTLMLPFLITALSLTASADMEFTVTPHPPKSDNPLRLRVEISGGHPDTSYTSSVSHQVSGSHITINIVTTRHTGGIYLPMIRPAGGSVEVGKLMPGLYSVSAYWYLSEFPGFFPTLREVGYFHFVVGFGETVPAVIKPAIQLVFPTEAGKVYQIYRSEDLDAWLPHGEVIVGDGNASRYHEATDGVRGFFQVVEVPQAAP